MTTSEQNAADLTSPINQTTVAFAACVSRQSIREFSKGAAIQAVLFASRTRDFTPRLIASLNFAVSVCIGSQNFGFGYTRVTKYHRC